MFMRILFIMLLSTALTACSMFSRKKDADKADVPQQAPAATEVNADAPLEEDTLSSPVDPRQVDPQKVARTEQPAVDNSEPQPSTQTESHSPEKAKKVTPKPTLVAVKGDVAPEKALGWLKNGNTRFMKKNWRRDGASRADVIRLSKTQKPHTIVISCSDSRVPPEVVFDQKLGEIYVVRTAGEIMDPAALASIEHAVANLGVRLILVMGHNRCDAVRAAIDTMGNNKDAGSDNLNSLVSAIRLNFDKLGGKPISKDLSRESWANANGVAKGLTTRSKIIRDRVQAGDIQIHTALYNLDSGVVDFTQ